MDEEGAPHISMFAVEDYWTGDIASFMMKKPTPYFIKATEHSELLGISRANYDLLYPQIVNRITQKDLAGYIGITPEFMSKIISKVNRM